MLSNVKRATEHPDHFAVDDGSGRPYRVAKAALSPAMVERVRRLYCGGPVRMAEGGPVPPLDPMNPPPGPDGVMVPGAVVPQVIPPPPPPAPEPLPVVPPPESLPLGGPALASQLQLDLGKAAEASGLDPLQRGRLGLLETLPELPAAAGPEAALLARAPAPAPEGEPVPDLPLGGPLTGGPSLASQLKLDLEPAMAALDPAQRALLAAQAIPELKVSSLEDLAASWLANRRALSLEEKGLTLGERAKEAVISAATTKQLKKFSVDDGKDVQGRLNAMAESQGLSDRLTLDGKLGAPALALAAKLKMAISPDGELVPVSSLGKTPGAVSAAADFAAGVAEAVGQPERVEPGETVITGPVNDPAVAAAIRAALPSPLSPEVLAALSPLDRAKLDLEAMGPLKLPSFEEGMDAAQRQLALERRVEGMKAGNDKQLAALDDSTAVDARVAVNAAAEAAGLEDRVPVTGKLSGKDGAAVRALADRAGAVITATGQVVGQDEVAAAQAELAATRPAESVRAATEPERKAFGKDVAKGIMEAVNAAAKAAGLKESVNPALASVGPKTLALATKAGLVITADGRVMKKADMDAANAAAAAPRTESQLTLAGPFAQGVRFDPVGRALLGLTAPVEEAPAAEAAAAPAKPKVDEATAASGAAPAAPAAPVNPFQATTLTPELAAEVVGANDAKLTADFLASKGMDATKVAAMKPEDRDKLMGEAVGAVAALRAKAVPVASEARADAFARGVDEQLAGLVMEAGEDTADELGALLQAQGLNLKPGTALSGTVTARAALLKAKADTQIQALRAAGETVKETGRLEEARLRETADLLRLQQQHQRTIDDTRTAQDRLFQEMQDPKNAELEQGRLLSRMNWGQHIGMWVMSILGGVSSGVRGGPNMAMEQFNAALARDIESQKAEKEAKRSIRFREYERMGASVDQAAKLLEADGKNLAAAQLAYQGAKAGTAKAKVALDQAAATMREQAREALSQAVVEITTQQFAAQAAERQGRMQEGAERRAESAERREEEEHPLRLALLRESLAKAGLRAASGRTAARVIRVGAARDAARLIADAPKDANGQPVAVELPPDVRGRMGQELTTEQLAMLDDDQRKMYVAEVQVDTTKPPKDGQPPAEVVRYRRALTDKAAEKLGAAEHAFRQLDALGRLAEKYREKDKDGNPIAGGGVRQMTGTDAATWTAAAKQAGLAIKTAEQMGALDAGSVEYMEQLLPDMTGFFRRDGTRAAQLDQYRTWVSGQRKSSRQQFLIGGH